MKMNWLGTVGGALVMTLVACACAGAPPASQTPASATAMAPCAPSDCAPCDLTKSKCTGPSVCDGHPEKAKSVCERNAAGVCTTTLVCE